MTSNKSKLIETEDRGICVPYFEILSNLDELQHMEIGECQLNYKGTVRLLKRFQSLVTVKLRGLHML
jgi:hypothetical protein